MKPIRITRRDMLIKTAGSIAALSLSSGCEPTQTQQTGDDQVTKRQFKIGACDWTLGKKTDLSSLEFAKKIGLDGIQLDFGSPKGNTLPLFDTELQQQFIDAAKAHNCEIGSLAMGALNSIPYKSDPRAAQWVSQGIDVCKAMNMEVMLLAFFGAGDLRDDKKGVDEVVNRLKNVAPKAEKMGVILGVESTLSAEQHMDIINRVGSPAVQVYYDVGNSHAAGYDIYKEIRYLKGHICEFHAKDHKGLYGNGSIDFPAVRQAMDDIGWRGWIMMEGSQMPLGLEDSCRYDYRYLKTVFPPNV